MDYLKGYDSRNSRRRSSYRRRRASSRRRKRHVRFTPFSLLKWAVPVVLVVAATFGICYIQWSGQSSDQTAHLAATAAGVDASQAASPEAVKGKVADEVKEVGALSPDSIVKPTPAPKVRSKAVALTFDDGPSTVNTPKILATLKKYNAHATFFVVGTRVSSGADILKQELAQGCEIANHTWDHADLSKLPMKKVNKECDRVADLVKKLHRVPDVLPGVQVHPVVGACGGGWGVWP